MAAREPEGAGGRGRRWRRRFSLARFLLLFAIAFFGVLLVAVLTPQQPYEVSGVMWDTDSVRQTCSLFLDTDAMPLAPDGRLDVYAVLKRHGLSREQKLRLCHSERSGKGPTWEEIEAGDYANYPYQRHRGPFDPGADPRVPVLWERVPSKLHGRDETGRVVGYSDGSTYFLIDDEEATLRRFFRENPGQE